MSTTKSTSGFDAAIASGQIPPDLVDDTPDIHFVPAPCQIACPIGTDAPSYIGLIWEGRYEDAFEAITATNPFSSVCGRVCDAPCEPACRRADSDGALGIRNLKRFVMDQLGEKIHLPPVQVTQKETVGIVGGGPAGLTAAQDLALAGYEVHIYEMSGKLGGMCAWGIPAFRLPERILVEDVDRLLKRCPGIHVHLNTALGEHVTLDQLKKKHTAILLTIGATWGKKMDIPGEEEFDAEAVDGVGFLKRINGGERPKMPETVLVIGGGDVAMDACRAAKRLPGCKTVKVVYRRGPNEIPARKDELEGALKEDIEFIYNTQPVAVVKDGSAIALRCVETELGEPGEDGRRKFQIKTGTEHDIACGMVIAAIGQKADSAELHGADLMDWDRVKADFNTMRTPDPQVFAAGDGAFGGSTIVMAMHHGHKAAYYIKAALQGHDNPVPYRTPHRTRRVTLAQDIMWEKFNRQEQDFHGLGKNPSEFPEIESAYDLKTAMAEAARCYRCDAETGSADYSVHNREDIFKMARIQPDNFEAQAELLRARMRPREILIEEGRPATLDDLVFLPANLSRLVIDPYREACKTATTIAGRMEMTHPYMAGGLDDAPDEVRAALTQALKTTGTAYIGAKAPAAGTLWLQMLDGGAGKPSADAAGIFQNLGGNFHPVELERATNEQMLGLAVKTKALEDAIPYALENGFDFLILDGSAGLGTPWSELKGGMDFTVLREAIRILRKLNKEEHIDLIYFGGVRTGTDVAKALALGANAGVTGIAMGLALGGQIQNGSMVFDGDRDGAERQAGAENLIKSMAAETSIMARCTGKTNVHNLEPEDMKSITLVSAETFGIPLVGKYAH